MSDVPLDLTIDIPENWWREWGDAEDDPRSRLGFTLHIAKGISLHLIAIEVLTTTVAATVQVSPRWDDELTMLAHLCNAEEFFETMTIKGREYTVFAVPFCQ